MIVDMRLFFAFVRLSRERESLYVEALLAHVLLNFLCARLLCTLAVSVRFDRADIESHGKQGLCTNQWAQVHLAHETPWETQERF